MQHSNTGKALLVAGLLSSAFTGCGTIPPAIPMCLGDGTGGADCVEFDGTPSARAPQDLKNFWMTDQESMNALVSWCYRTEPEALFPVQQTEKPKKKEKKK